MSSNDPHNRSTSTQGALVTVAAAFPQLARARRRYLRGACDLACRGREDAATDALRIAIAIASELDLTGR